MKKIFSNLEESTTYLVEHLTENATADDLINHFTDIQNEHDDVIDEFRQMLQKKYRRNNSATAEQLHNNSWFSATTAITSLGFQPDVNNIQQQPSARIISTANSRGQNSSDSRDTQQQAPQTVFEITTTINDRRFNYQNTTPPTQASASTQLQNSSSF